MFLRRLELYALPFLISFGFCLGLGLWDLLLTLEESLLFLLIVLCNTIFLIFIKQCTQLIFKSISVLICILVILYIATGTGFQQGHMSIGIVASILQTDQKEVLEFFSVVHFKYIIYAALLCFSLLYFFFFSNKNYPLKLNKIFIASVLIFNVFNLFFIQTARAVIKYKKEERILYQGNKTTPNWNITKVEPLYDNQVFIIGESVQRNFLSLYGYSQKTTPFLDSMPVQVVDEYISASANTAMSLPRTLAYTDEHKNIHISMNVMSLANQAQYNTIWISNQGFLGRNDTAVSKVAIHAQHKIFLKSGNYRSKDIDDEIMVPMLGQQLNQYKNKKNIIFIHMMGSHPDACERLFNSPELYPEQTDSMNCYLSSINKLDGFIQQIHQELSKTNRSFSITYFSDHGMSVTPDGVYVDNDSKENYQVPFFVLSSDDKQKKRIEKRVSAYDFMDIYAGQIGVDTPLLSVDKHLNTIQNNSNVTVFDWEDDIPYNSLK